MIHHKNKTIHSTGVANHFWNLAKDQSKFLTQMQLQKLVYFAHGWHLALFESGLTVDQLEAWDYGPFYRQLWLATRKYGNDPVIERIRISDLPSNSMIFEDNLSLTTEEFCHASLNSDQEQLVQRVFEVYGNLGAFELSDLTHKRGTPWYETYVENELRRQPIPQNLIKNHFLLIAKSSEENNDKAK